MRYYIPHQHEFEHMKVYLIYRCVRDICVDVVGNVHVTLSVFFTIIDLVQSFCGMLRNVVNFSLGMFEPVRGNPLWLSLQTVDLIQQLLVGTLCVVINNYHVE